MCTIGNCLPSQWCVNSLYCYFYNGSDSPQVKIFSFTDCKKTSFIFITDKRVPDLILHEYWTLRESIMGSSLFFATYLHPFPPFITPSFPFFSFFIPLSTGGSYGRCWILGTGRFGEKCFGPATNCKCFFFFSPFM